MPLQKKRRSFNVQGIVLVAVLAGAVAFLLLRDSQPALEVALPDQYQISPTPEDNSWQDLLHEQVVENATPLPQVAIPTEQYIPPTLVPIDQALAIAVQPNELQPQATATVLLEALATPTEYQPLASGVEVVSVASSDTVWQPPPLQEPLSYDPRDHYWFARPVDSDAVNYGLFYYNYGADGPDDDWRVHHGIDMANPIGESVRAAGAGTVLWAADGFRVELPDGTITETTDSYGNTVLIQHNFGYRGQKLYTLYAHLSAVLVTRGQQVETGDIIGLVGDTGIVSGSHVHFEVRLGQNSWYAVRNPTLWMVPYAGHGTLAGQVIGPDGELLYDHDISVIDRQTGRVVQTTTSYADADTNLDGWTDINSDDIWQENFSLGDIPEGRYTVVTRIDGSRVARVVDIYEGTTTFIEIALPEEATPQPLAE